MINTITIKKVKALILGDSGVGKTALFRRLQGREFMPTESTHGFSVSRITIPDSLLPTPSEPKLKGELELWDLAGQPDYNVVHQIFVQDAKLALIVIDESNSDTIESIRYWDDWLKKHCLELQTKILISARVDRGASYFDQITLEDQAKSLGYEGFFHTSALSGEGLNHLRNGLLNSIEWEEQTQVVMPASWQVAKKSIRKLTKNHNNLITISAIHNQLGEDNFGREEIETILMFMHNAGELFVLQPRQDTKLVLLDPNVLSNYGSAIFLAARTNTRGAGEIEESAILRSDIDLRRVDRFPALEERIILDTVVSLLLQTESCYRKSGKLIFPSQVRDQICFLSHNSADKPTAEELGIRLLDKGIDVWLDKWEILAGESITSKIEEGIDKATAFIILMSPNSMKAKWVREELRIALQKRMESSDFILIPILIRDCEIPGFLRDYVYVDWRVPSEEAFNFLVNSVQKTKMKPGGG